MKIITLTLSPAIDIHCQAEDFSAERENFAKATSRDAGGKGINISRALLSQGIKSHAIIALGEENADGFLSSLTADGIDFSAIKTKGRIRENITIHPKNAKETRLSFEGFCGNDSLYNQVENQITSICENGDIIAIAGSIPEGIDTKKIKALAIRLRGLGARVIIDSRSLSPADIIECAPFLIKPNEEEAAAYADNAISIDDAAKVAKEIMENGVENVMISLGEIGAVLACKDGVFFAKAPKINALSTVGAGDSSIAGFIAAYTEGKPLYDCLKAAVAFGSAACLTSGTKPPRTDDIIALMSQISVDKKEEI